MAVTKEKQNELVNRMKQLGLKDEDILEKFVLGSSSGGQKINKTASCVYLKHLPTGIEVKCQQDRSRETNRFLARRMLCDRFEEQVLSIKSKKQIQMEKIRKQKKRRARKSLVKRDQESTPQEKPNESAP